ncbi:zinc finger and SCAN domain-containing protein 31-like isoform X3 [Periplaneta americana]
MEVIKVEPLAVDGLQTQSSIFGEVANESKSHNEFKEEEEEEEEEEEVKVKEEEAAAVPFIFVAVNTETEAESDYLPEVKKEVAEEEIMEDNVGVLGAALPYQQSISNSAREKEVKFVDGRLPEEMKLANSSSEDKNVLKCDRCEKFFIYSETGNFLCKKCNDEDLKMKAIAGDKQYSCNQCSKFFARKEGLKRHVRIHTGEKAYSCELCGKNFHTIIHY